MQAVIMVGGSGVRLRPFTYLVPKPLLPLGNVTILEYMVKSLSNQGVGEVFLITSYQKNRFDQCSEYGSRYGIKVNICFEGKMMGTAGGITLLRNQVNSDFLLLNGDLVVKMDFVSMLENHKNNRADITIGITKYSFTVPHGVIDLDDRSEFVDISEKPTYSFMINAGIYAINPSIVGLLGSKENLEYLDMPSLVTFARDNQMKVNVFNIGEHWLDTGKLVDYERAVDAIEAWMEKDDLTSVAGVNR